MIWHNEDDAFVYSRDKSSWVLQVRETLHQFLRKRLGMVNNPAIEIKGECWNCDFHCSSYLAMRWDRRSQIAYTFGASVLFTWFLRLRWCDAIRSQIANRTNITMFHFFLPKIVIVPCDPIEVNDWSTGLQQMNLTWSKSFFTASFVSKTVNVIYCGLVSFGEVFNFTIFNEWEYGHK